MRVLVLAQYFPPDMGGGSTRACNVVKGLLSKDCDVTLVAAFPHYPHGKVPSQYKHKAVVSERFGAAKVFRVWIPALAHSSPLKRIILHLCFIISSLFALPFVGKVDVVWGANPNLFCFFPSFVYAVVKGVPIVRNVDDLWPEVFYELGYVKPKFARKVLDFVAWFSYVVPAAITPISAGYKRNIVAKYRISPDKVHVIEVGVERIAPFSACRKSKDRFVVMYSGVIGLGYDFDVMLEAAWFLGTNDHIVFVIRGVGELSPRLNKAITERGLRNVVLDTRFLPKDELVAFLGTADVFVLPMATMSFVNLGLPTKVFEYQAYGKPIICVSDGEPARYIESTKSGLIVKPKDAIGFAEAVIRLYKDTNIVAELGWNGRRFVSENLTAEKIGARMYEVLASTAKPFLLAPFPSKQQLTQLLEGDDYFLWEYYGKILGWIFRSRIEVIVRFMKRLQPKPMMLLDVGCGPMFISCPLVKNSASEYIGVDVMPVERLKKYKDVMKKIGVQTIEVIRASAEFLPLRDGVFDFVLSLDVLEHLSKPKGAIMEINRVSNEGGSIAISLPLENLFQKLSRLGFKFMEPKPFSNNAQGPVLKRAKKVPITKMPEYHYVGDVGSYDDMYELLKDIFEPLHTKYTPLGFHRSININAVHIFKK